MESKRPIRLFPLPAEEILGGVYEGFGETLRGVRFPSDRPYTVINMVSTVDGKATIGGRAGGIAGEADREAMRNLRAWSDAVMIGAETLRAEKLSLSVSDNLAGQREARGKSPQPLAVILSSSGDLPLDNLVTTSHESLLLVTSGECPKGVRSLSVRPGEEGRPDLGSVVSALRAEFQVDSLLVEGGPTLNRSLIERDLADEFLITVSPGISGGEIGSFLTAVEGELGPHDFSRLNLTSVHLSDNHLFLRYTR